MHTSAKIRKLAADPNHSIREAQEDWFKSLGEALTAEVKFSDYRKPRTDSFTSEGLRWSHGYMDLDDPSKDDSDRVTFVFELKRDEIHFWVLYNREEIGHTRYSTIRTIKHLAEETVQFAYEAVAKKFEFS